MSTVVAEMAKNSDQRTRDREASAAKTALDRSYLQIGIQAVAAAARYQGAAKNPAYAPAQTGNWFELGEEAAA